MEVGRIGQGGPINLDLNAARQESSKGEAVEGQSMLPAEVKVEAPVKEKDLNKAVDKLNKFLEDDNVHVEYSVHEKLRDVMIKIVNTDTKEVIMEIPPKKILDMVAKMCELVGILVDKKA